MQFVRNVLVYVFGIFTRVFCYCFYEGFIHKIILVSGFLPCISYPLKVFRFGTEIFCDLCAVPLLKLWGDYHRVKLFYVWFCFSCLLAIIFPFAHLQQWFTERQQKHCWILLLHWIQLCSLLTLSKSMFFELPVLIPLVLYLIRSVSAEVSLNCISRIRFKCSFFWPWENQYMVDGFDSISTAQFSAIICAASAEGFLNCVAHLIYMFVLLNLNISFLFILCAFAACLPFSSA